MVEEKPTQSAGDTTQSEGDKQTNSEIDKAYEKLLLENKKYRARAQEMEKKYQSLEQEKLQEQGKWKELAEQKTKAVEEYEKNFKETTSKFAYRVVTSQVQAEAAKLGCIDPEALIQLAPISELECDDSFNVNTESVKKLLDNMQKSKPYLFKKETPMVKDGVPTSKVDLATDWKKLSLKDQARLAVQKLK